MTEIVQMFMTGSGYFYCGSEIVKKQVRAWRKV